MTKSTGEGNFSVPALHAGTYTVTASAKGFGTYTVNDIVLSSLDNKTVELTLPINTVSETVVVSASNSSIVEEDSGAKSETVTSDDLQNMTLSSRNAAEVVKLMSGATLTANGGVNRSATTNLIGMNTFTPGGTAAGLGGTLINGQGVDLTMDGSHDFDPGSPGANTPVNPNMDMISELKVLSSSFSAEYEHGPVVVNAETKGGGNRYHGQVHFYAQHNALNALDSTFKIQNQTTGNTHQYYPGAQISGPVPSIFGFNKNKDKLFFFDGFEMYLQHLAPGLDQAVVPTDDMYNGNFDPNAATNRNLRQVGNLSPYIDTKGNYQNVPKFNTNGTYAPYRPNCNISSNYVLSSGCISPIGLKLLQSYFAVTKVGMVDPTTHNGWNYVHNTTTDFNQWQNVARIDWSVSDNTKVYVRINTSRESANNPNGVWGSSVGNEVIPAPTLDVAQNTADDIAAALTHVFSPTLTSESTFAWSKVTMPNKPQDPSKISRSAIGLPESVWGQDAIPTFTNWSPGFPGLGPGGNYVRNPLQMKADKYMPSARTNVTKVLGAHTLKAGGYWEFIENSQDPYGNFNGLITVPQGWGQDVGNSYATMLMGILGNDYSEQQDTPIIGNKANQFRFFVNDHWKVKRRLTVDVGMRFDHMGLYSPTSDTGMAIWDEKRYNNDPSTLDQHTGVYWHGIDKSVRVSGVNERVFFYSPRFGLAYDLLGHGNTIVRGGYGRFYAYQKLSDQFTGAEMTAYGAASLDCPNSNCPVYETLGANNPYMAPYVNHTLPAGIAPGLQSVSTLDPHLNNFPYVTTYNVQIDQKLPWKVMLEASYVGNYGQDFQYQADINAIPAGRINEQWVLTCANTANCSENYDSGTDPNGAYWRPRQNYRSINKSILAGKTQYDGFQVSAHRNSGILFLLTNFTWSKAYSNAAVQNGGSYASLPDYGVSEYWGVSPDNRKFTFNASYTLTEPTFNVANHTLREVINGWQLSGVTQLSSGANMTSNGGINFAYGYGNDTSYNSSTKVTTTLAEHDNVALIGGNQATVFPTLICNPVMSHHEVIPVSQTNPFGGRRYLNPACFAPTTSGLGSTHDMYFSGPAFFNSDLSLMKTVKIGDRQNVQFKFQAFNFLNHPLWSFNSGDPNLHLSFNGQQYTDGVLTQKGGVLAPSNAAGDQFFGVASLRTGHRTVQLEARYWF